ncbi:MSMEG_0570 family nitrogen starvation response protein [Pseudonocardia ailaonensis]
MLFDVRWPDGSTESFYSPSLIVEEYLRVGAGYPVTEFVDLTRTCMQIADQRVRAKYGMGCAESAHTLSRVEGAAARFEGSQEVTVERFRR